VDSFYKKHNRLSEAEMIQSLVLQSRHRILDPTHISPINSLLLLVNVYVSQYDNQSRKNKDGSRLKLGRLLFGRIRSDYRSQTGGLDNQRCSLAYHNMGNLY
jgi:hypothetical protein